MMVKLAEHSMEPTVPSFLPLNPKTLHKVFILLQAIYGAFDELAKRRRVFKVEVSPRPARPVSRLILTFAEHLLPCSFLYF